MESESTQHPADALATISETRAAAADRLITPWWYHPILGLWIGAYLVVIGHTSFQQTLFVVIAFLLGCFLLMNAYRRKTGVWISGLTAGPASRWAGAMATVAVVGVIAVMALREIGAPSWPSWTIGGVVAVATVALGRKFDTALRAHLRDGA